MALFAVENMRGYSAAKAGVPDPLMADAMSEIPEQAPLILFKAECAVRDAENRARIQAGKY